MPSEPDDGLDWGSVTAKPIRDDQRYGGVRVTTSAILSSARVPVQIDIGFGDAITPGPVEDVWKELLGFPEARLLTYPPETVIAEKLEAAVDLEMANSRMKDFYDLDWLRANREFDFGTVRAAVLATFERRSSALPENTPVALTEEFATDPTKVTQWGAFLRKNQLDADPLNEVVTRLHGFLTPVLTDAHDPSAKWNPATGWT